MEQINKQETSIWDKSIELKLSLWELQMLRDAFGATNEKERSERFELNYSNERLKSPYYLNEYNSTELYGNLNLIVKENGGIA